jgi:glycerophosphoryl diester phosphodiesterase
LAVRPLISAHRGRCGIDGLPAAERYRAAIELGVDYVEFDVRRTADGVHVAYHDPRTPSGRSISSLTFEEVKAELGSQALTLHELLDIANGRVGLHIDLKEVGYEAEIVSLALAHFTAGQFVITSLEDVSIRTIKEQFPQVRAGLSLGRDINEVPVWRRLGVRLSELFPDRRLRRCHADFAAVHEQLARIRLLRYCARKRLPAWVWTVDDEVEMARFLADPRVTALITNRPDVALQLRARRR